MARCVPVVMGEGLGQKQAVGKCEGMYSAAKKKEALSETSGADLKTRLGLASFPKVYMSRIVGTGLPAFYVVIYDSRRPDFPITSSIIRGPHTPFLSKTPFSHRLKIMPLVPIEKFIYDPIGTMLLVIDLAGRFGKDGFKPTTEATVNDVYRAAHAISGITMKYRKQRTRALGPENRTAKLADVMVQPEDDSVTILFSTPATRVPAKQTHPSAGYGLYPNPSGKYVIAIKILKFFTWLKTAPDPSKVTVDDIRTIMRVADVQLSSTSPSFYWQGFAYNLTQLGAAIYPVDIPPEVWGPRHYYALVDKHVYGVLSQWNFFVPFIAQAIDKKLRAAGHVTRPVTQTRRPRAI